MGVKSNVKKRRAERIRQLTLEDAAGPLLPDGGRDSGSYSAVRPGLGGSMDSKAGTRPGGHPQSGETGTSGFDAERDPELLWKRGQGRWEELYGGFGGKEDPPPPAGKRSSFWTAMFTRLVISALLFLGIWGIERYEPSWSLPVRAFVAQSLTEEMDFQALETWYERYFGGAPSFIPIFKHHEDNGLKVGATSGFVAPVSGSPAGSFALSLKGVEIIPEQAENGVVQVKSIATGRVLGVTRDPAKGETVTVQHADGYISIYGRLEQTAVEKGDWLEGGDIVGTLPPGTEPPLPTLYFALQKDDRYIDPADVIPFD
ncbi:M23 family metallopeptidase [Paenibacillus oralis]|uniref:M23 family metallopeptidase n=1 Tax=Paenibacillus oralis TaxID=2490856 RepID=A0A3P3TWB9_9BACL|nr:M23 family metallopeptidase [Paenibacillus oralis]RRJ61548.1 M23 family metallopeptidase [Paenibacillus oralis]